MHSSRMRTARLLLIYPSMHCSGGLLVPGGACSLGGCLLFWGRGSDPGGVCIPACTEADTPRNRITDNFVAGGKYVRSVNTLVLDLSLHCIRCGFSIYPSLKILYSLFYLDTIHFIYQVTSTPVFQNLASLLKKLSYFSPRYALPDPRRGEGPNSFIFKQLWLVGQFYFIVNFDFPFSYNS